MAQETENNTSQLLSHLKGLVKQYLVYDSQGRVSASYVAPIGVEPGRPCVRTRYAFKNATSSDIIARIEENSVWDPDNQGWDTGQPTGFGSLPSPLVNDP